jgi:hypothetical protein
MQMPEPEPPPIGGFYWGVADAGRQVEGNLTNDDWEIFTSDPQILWRLSEFKAQNKLSINPQRAEGALITGTYRPSSNRSSVHKLLV